MRLSPALIAALIAATAAAAATAPRRDPAPSAKALALARAVRDGRGEAKGVQAQIDYLRERLVALAAVEAVGERGDGDKRTRLDRLTRDEANLAARLDRSRGATADLLGLLILYRRDPPPALLVHPRSALDAVRAQILARAMAPELEARSRALTDQLQCLRRLRGQVGAAREDLFQSQDSLARQRAQLQQLIADRTVLQKSLMTDADAADAQLRDLARRSGAPADLLRRLAATSQDLGPAPDRLFEPVPGRLSARYGQAAVKGGPAQGYSWTAGPGAPVLAPAEGVVEYAGPLKDYGHVLILRTGGAYHLVLTGLGASDAVAGQKVAAGEPIGRMAEDAGPRPSLYLEVRRGGETVDPQRWFKTTAH